MNDEDLLDLVVTLDDAQIDPVKEGFLLGKDRGSLREEPLHEICLAGCGRVNDDHKLFDLPGLAVLILLDQRHVAVQLHPIIIESIIK